MFLLEILIDLKSVSVTVFSGVRLMTKLNEYVKVAEAAEILGVAQGTVWSWAEAGKIPMHKTRQMDIDCFGERICWIFFEWLASHRDQARRERTDSSKSPQINIHSTQY